MARRAVIVALVAALSVAAPSAAPAARTTCAKRMSCKGKAGAFRAGVPVSWTKRKALPGAGAGPAVAQPAANQGGGKTPGTPAPPLLPPLPPEDPRYVQVVASDSDPDDFTLTLSRTTLLAGAVSVEFNNRFAEDPHDLWLRRGGATYRFDPIDAGAAATKGFSLGAGAWKLWCDIGDHEQRGMVATITVLAG